ncbi:MAG: hypothetical protein ACI9K3_001246 [Halovenus sp.]
MSETEPRCARAVTAEGVSVPFRVDQITGGSGQPEHTLYCTDIEGTELRVSAHRSLVPDPAWETGEWYQFDDVRRSDSSGAELRVPSGAAVEGTAAPEQKTQPSPTALEDPWLLQLGASKERVAVTVQPRPTGTVAGIRADDPDTFEIGAVCFAHGDGDTAVYHREEPDHTDEQHLLEHVVRDLTEADGATLLTGGTGQSPLELLGTRLDVAADGDIVDEGAAGALEGCFHADLRRVAARMGVDTLGAVAQQLGIEHSPVRLDSYDLGIAPADWRADWDIDDTPLSSVADPQMTDRDYAFLVERYLGDESESEHASEHSRCLKAHASAELSVLGELGADDAVGRLGCPRLGRSA